MANNVEVLIEDTLRSLGYFTEEQISAARSRGDGFVGEHNGVKYYRNSDYHDFHTEKSTVSMPDQQGEGYRPTRRH